MYDLPAVSVIDTKKNRLKRNIIAELYRSDSRTIAQLASVLHSSVPSVTALIDELATAKWIWGIGTGAAQMGRKPSLYALKPDHYVTVVLDITIHDTKLLVFDLTNQVVLRMDLALPLGDSPAFISELQKPMQQLAQKLTAMELVVIGVGATMPGLVNPELGLNFTHPELNEPGQSLNSLVESLFDAPLYVINDTKATLFGESKFGLAQGKKHVLSINIDWGIGLGVMINGDILQGTAGFAGELGHIQIATDGELCTCGKVGCLDTLTSASALIRRARLGLAQGQPSMLANEGSSDALTIELIIDKANAGDAFCIDLLRDAGSELGRGLAMAVHLFNPELIIVNGVLAKAANAITCPIEQALIHHCLPDYRNNLTIELSHLGEMAKLYGTHAYVLQRLLDHEQIP
ncbi:ROK family transcriptional regulator [Fibrella forsythiae]|uniref:ROK family transcriptional regulator n=1 Tax=Fibrella forsythiae TaxID=2817061 RepID=A0ABS3JN35_9BACT|nr:ROK family transcriptional regulator [Fibrella forsythiae]MBO0950821.1 ROK family transcriptional regulator [Fibrella forsythiae]